MLFNTIDFAAFLILVFSIYWLLQDTKLWYQNLFLLVSSYVFYGWWEWKFLVLIFSSSIIDYFIGIELGKSSKQKKKGD